jgi:hypothetical protein
MFKRGCNGCGEFWYIGNDSTCKCPDETPKKKWVGLTDEEFNECLVEGDPCEALAEPEAWEVMRSVEAKIKEKNHG